MPHKPTKPAHPGRAGDPVSLAPLTPDQALAGLLKVKLADVKALEAEAGVREAAPVKKARTGKKKG